MEKMEIEFTVLDGLDFYNRLYVAKCGCYEFEFVAQYWDGETGKFLGTTPDIYVMHSGPKYPGDTAQWFTESPAWDAFEAATGVTEKAFLRAFAELIEDEAAKADEEARALVLKLEGLTKDLTFVDEGGDRIDGRIFTALYGEYRFSFIAQLLDDEGRPVGTHPEAGVMHYVLKSDEEGSALFFCGSPAWDAFGAATGVTPEAFLWAFEELIEDEAEAAKADED